MPFLGIGRKKKAREKEGKQKGKSKGTTATTATSSIASSDGTSAYQQQQTARIAGAHGTATARKYWQQQKKKNKKRNKALGRTDPKLAVQIAEREQIQDHLEPTRTALERWREERGLRGGTEYMVDWGNAGRRAQGLKSGYLQMLGLDGSWKDVRVTLQSTYLSIQRLEEETLRIDTLIDDRKQEEQRRVTIRKARGEPLGVAIKGGKEHGLPLLVSQMKEGSPVARSAECFVGDEVLAVNGFVLESASQAEAISILRQQLNETKVTIVLRYFSAAAHHLVRDYLRSANPIPVEHKHKKWAELLKIPIAHCTVSIYEETSASERDLQAFFVRAAIDVTRRAVLRPAFGKVKERDSWASAIRTARDHLPCPPLCKPRPPLDFTGRVEHTGRVHLRGENGAWHDLFLVLTDHDFSLHTSPPTCPGDLSNPSRCFPLLATTLKRGCREHTPGNPLDARELSDGMFSITVPYTRFYLGAGSNEMAMRWKAMFETRTDDAVRKMGSITYAATLDGVDVALTLNWQTGLWLNNDSRGDKSLVSQHPFSALKASHCPNGRTLALQFDEEDDIFVELENAALVRCVLDSFVGCHERAEQQIHNYTVA